MPSATARSSRLPSVSRYEFCSAIGEGGWGTVYRAFDHQTRQHVAIKVLRVSLTENPTQHHRLAQEFRAATQLEHPNIVRAFEIGNDGNLSYLVYELIEGISLGERIEKRGRLKESDAIRIATQVAQALHYAHLRNVIHRDVKPDNILVLPDGRAKLTDFGLAKDYNNDQDLTRHASGLGTPNFMAPEQFADAKTVGPKSDVYSLAATLYAALTGRLPFDAKTALATLTKKELEIPSVRALVPEVRDRVDAAIRAALNPDPKKRPRSCLEFFKLLTARPKFDDGNEDDLPASVAVLAAPANERRAWVRHPLDIGSCVLIDTSAVGTGQPQSEEMWPLVIRDLSVGGAGILLARRFEPGTELVIELNAFDGTPRRLPARVVRVVPEKGGHWVHGCAFDTPLTEEQLTALLPYA